MPADADPVSTPAADSWTVRRILEATTTHLKKHGSETPRLDAEILLAHCRGCERIQLYTRYDELVTDAQRSSMRDLVKRRSQAEPVAYLVGYREFFSLPFRVNKTVLIPRPDTETLVMESLDLLREVPAPNILELGTGSGCIVTALAAHLPRASFTAVDLCPDALAVARENAARNEVAGRIEFLEGDLFAPLPEGNRFDLVVSNPPYVSTGDYETLDPTVRRHEPALALLAGVDGLDVIRRLVHAAPAFLQSGGWLTLEIGSEQSSAVEALLLEHGEFSDVRTRKDLAGLPRVVRGRRK